MGKARIKVVKDNPSGNLLQAGFYTQDSLSRRHASADVTIITTDLKSLPTDFQVENYKMSGSTMVIKPASERFSYVLSSDASNPATGFFQDIPSFTADGSAKARITIVKKDGNSVAMKSHTDNDTLDICTSVGATSGNITSLALASGIVNTNITSPTSAAQGFIKVRKASEVTRKGEFQIQAD